MKTHWQNRVRRTVLGVLVASGVPGFMAEQAFAQISFPVRPSFPAFPSRQPSPSPSPSPSPPPPSTTAINDNDPSIVYSRHTNCCDEWIIGNNSGDFNGDEHYSNVTRNPSPGTQVYGADVVVNFNGTGITWIGRTGPQFGIAAYSVDGGPVSFVDAYSPTTVYQTQNAVITGLSPGSHSLKIEVTSSHNAASSDYYQVVDAFVVQGGTGGISPTQTIGAIKCGNLSCMGPYLFGPSGQTYDGTGSNGWGCFETYPGYPWNYGDISGYHCITGLAGSYLSWPFSGSLIEVYGRPDAENGFSNIYIDGVFVKTVDWVWGTIDDDLVNSYNVFTWQGNPGNHTITIIATGTSSGTQGSLLQIDTLMAFP